MVVDTLAEVLAAAEVEVLGLPALVDVGPDASGEPLVLVTAPALWSEVVVTERAETADLAPPPQAVARPATRRVPAATLIRQETEVSRDMLPLRARSRSGSCPKRIERRSPVAAGRGR